MTYLYCFFGNFFLVVPLNCFFFYIQEIVDQFIVPDIPDIVCAQSF